MSLGRLTYEITGNLNMVIPPPHTQTEYLSEPSDTTHLSFIWKTLKIKESTEKNVANIVFLPHRVEIHYLFTSNFLT